MRVSASSACLCLSLALATGLSGAVSAPPRPVVDARRVTFNPSPDDGAIDGNGDPLVDRYTLEIFLANSDTLVEAVNVGKPTPDSDGIVRLDFGPFLDVPLTPGVVYQAVVQAVGPFGSADSERSNTFTFSVPPCNPWISPVSIDVEAAGGSSAITVHDGAGCAWTAASNDSWLTITGADTGAGNGTVTFVVAPNTDRNARHGTLTVAGAKFRVNQDGAKVKQLGNALVRKNDTDKDKGGGKKKRKG